MEKIGYKPRENENHTYSIIRGGLIATASKLGSIKATEFGMQYYERLKNGDKISADILPTVLHIAAGETNDYDWFYNKFENAANEVENQLYGTAMASFSNKEILAKVQEQFVFEKVAPRNQGNIIAALCLNDIAIPSMWHFYLANLDSFEKLHQFIYARTLSTLIACSTAYRGEITDFFVEYVKKNNMVKDSVDSGLELMEIRAKLKERTLSD